MDIVSLAGVGILCAALCVIVRQYKPEAALGISIACGILILGSVVGMLSSSVETLAALADSAGIDTSFTQALLKALAICYITQLSADCARDAGEGAIASKLELAGKAAIVVVSLPIFTSLAQTVTNLMNT